MKLLYWNLKANPNLESIIKYCIEENEIDIAVFSEFEKLDFEKLITILNNNFKLLESCGGCDKVRILYKNTIVLSTLLEHQRYLFALIENNNKKYILVGVHLPSNTNGDRSSDRKSVIRKIINDLAENENNDVTSSIVIGDMNASPFDDEMIEKDAFNAVLFKRLIKHKESVVFQGDVYRRFYNPIIEYISEKDGAYGSFYYGSGNGCLYWYCYDQLLVRKNLSDKISSFKYLKKINNMNLLKNIKPNASISDHLPLVVEIIF